MRQYKNKTTGAIFNKAINGNSYYSDKYQGYYIPSELIENSCDYEEVIEKDYELINWIDEKGNIYRNKESVGSISGDGQLHITYVERLSDFERFTVGDKIRFIDESLEEMYPCRIIRRFKLKDNSIIAVCDDNGVEILLKNLKRVKTSLFTTEDGVEVFENDSFYYIGDAWNICLTNCLFKGDGDFSKFKTFAEKENAEEYIRLNEPKYSLNDMAKIANHWAYIKVVTPEHVLKTIEKWKN